RCRRWRGNDFKSASFGGAFFGGGWDGVPLGDQQERAENDHAAVEGEDAAPAPTMVEQARSGAAPDGADGAEAVDHARGGGCALFGAEVDGSGAGNQAVRREHEQANEEEARAHGE